MTISQLKFFESLAVTGNLGIRKIFKSKFFERVWENFCSQKLSQLPSPFSFSFSFSFFFSFFLKILLIFCLFSFFPQTTFADLAQNYYKRGLEAQSVDEKLKYFTITLKLDPNFSEALIAKAETLFQMNNLDAAQKDVDSYIEKYPSTARAFTLCGNLAQRQGKLLKAEENYDNALKLDSKYDEVNFQKGLLLITIGKLKSDTKVFENALSFFKNVLETSVFFEKALWQAARCSEYLLKFEDTLTFYQTLTQKVPDSAAFFFHLGRLQYMNDQYSEAVASIDRACELTFKDQTLKVFYGVFRYCIAAQKLKEETSATYQLNLFLDKIPESLLGKLFQGKITDEEYLTQTLKLDSTKNLSDKRRQLMTCEMYCHMGYYNLLKNKTDSAFIHFSKAIEKNIFGSEFYSIAKFEYQKLAIHQEINAPEK